MSNSSLLPQSRLQESHGAGAEAAPNQPSESQDGPFQKQSVTPFWSKRLQDTIASVVPVATRALLQLPISQGREHVTRLQRTISNVAKTTDPTMLEPELLRVDEAFEALAEANPFLRSAMYSNAFKGFASSIRSAVANLDLPEPEEVALVETPPAKPGSRISARTERLRDLTEEFRALVLSNIRRPEVRVKMAASFTEINKLLSQESEQPGTTAAFVSRVQSIRADFEAYARSQHPAANMLPFSPHTVEPVTKKAQQIVRAAEEVLQLPKRQLIPTSNRRQTASVTPTAA